MNYNTIINYVDGIGPTKDINLDYHKLTHCHTVAQPRSLTLCVFCVILMHAVLGTEQHKVSDLPHILES